MRTVSVLLSKVVTFRGTCLHKMLLLVITAHQSAACSVSHQLSFAGMELRVIHTILIVADNAHTVDSRYERLRYMQSHATGKIFSTPDQNPRISFDRSNHSIQMTLWMSSIRLYCESTACCTS